MGMPESLRKAIEKMAIAYHRKGKSRELFLEKVQEYLDEAIEGGEFETGGTVSLRAINELTNAAIEAAKIWHNCSTYSVVVTSTRSALPDVYEIDTNPRRLHEAVGMLWTQEYRRQGYEIIHTEIKLIK